jgi:hypothetical protein
MISKDFYEIKFTKAIAQAYGMESKRVWMIWNLYREIERTGAFVILIWNITRS